MNKTIKYPFAKRLARIYLKGKSNYYFWGIITLILTILLTTILPNYIQKSIDLLNLYDTLQGQDVSNAKSELRYYAAIIIISGFVLCLVRSLSRILIFIPGRQIENDLRQDFFIATTKMSPSDVNSYEIGDLISRGTNDLSSIRIMISMGILHVINSSLMIILCLYFMFQISAEMTLLCLLPLPLLILGTQVISRKMLYYSRVAQKQLGQLSESTRELLKAYDLFAIFDVLPYIRDNFDKDNDEYLTYSNGLAKCRVYMLGITVGVVNLAIFLLIYFGGKLVLEDQLTVGQFVSFSLYINILMNPLRAVGWLLSALQRGETCLARIFPIIDLAEKYQNEQKKKSIQTEEDFKQLRLKNDTLIKANNLSFAYNKENNDFHLKIDQLSIERGKKYGIFGKTGSGKTTLLKLLASKFNSYQGELKINGLSYNDISQEILSQQFSFLFQENRHFIGSLEDNLEDIATSGVMKSYKQSTSIDDAYHISQLADDIDQLPDREVTILGEFGLNLSGGQKQRLALARSLVYPSQILFLDDFISAVDHKTEKIIIDNIFAQKNHSIIFTSHRLSALERCDEIWLMKNGKIYKKANHQQLMQEDKEYAAIYRYQKIESKIEEMK